MRQILTPDSDRKFWPQILAADSAPTATQAKNKGQSDRPVPIEAAIFIIN